ncbi:SLC13 family permease [Microbulbifer thermotolerans]|uniref:SLC13 family permease n=1 Tax=Microbulbifer thermotolerans TaxID=252514 RepID=A0AB35I0Y7_MICTH|nr:SLC13 family permease [Microbulbifer thermotolerans]MCX2802759.1 SLC13 family permease [Microbulbifer thermotolerans]MCX2832252.1 SLC13 family permease [Microbulbifer thermotolerans]MCX2842323.1 SLC13 family permease [Microbulbifer thermotolerans]
MTMDQLAILTILAVTIGLFIWGPWRHDMVALASLLACVFTGLIQPEDAFKGFGHPAVVTVASVLILSRGLQNTGAMDALAHRVVPTRGSATLSIAALTGLGALMSGFMNNVGAMALLMPVASEVADKQQLPPGKVLMPLSFGTILGGMTTLIGTPPNLIVSGFRASAGAGSYGMFDFTPVGLAVALVGVLFVSLIGWRLVPARTQAGAATFDTGTYLTEALVEEKSAAADKSLREIMHILEREDAQVVGVVHNNARVSPAIPWQRVHAGDILVLEAEPEALSTAISSLGLKLAGEQEKEEEKTRGKDGAGDGREQESPAPKKEKEKSGTVHGDVQLRELVVMPDSSLVGRTAQFLRLPTRYEINLLALSRQGRRSIRRLKSTPLLAGDALLMMGTDEALSTFAHEQGCVPLAQRDISIPNKEKAAVALVAMAIAVGGAAFGLLPAAISFATCALAFMVLKVVPLRGFYESIDGSVIVLLGTLISVAEVMEYTGAADLIAQEVLDTIAQGSPVIALVILLVVTMTLSDFMNNAATAAVMCSIALSTAAQLNANPDSFLMAVAIGASCAFLTPVGHQNNTLILGPGGFKFGDYWRMGLPMEILVILVSVPVLLKVWPL